MMGICVMRLQWAPVVITDGDYDFSEDVRSFDWGFTAGANYNISKRYFATGQFNYGAQDIMKDDFESISFSLHNIYVNLGVGVKF